METAEDLVEVPRLTVKRGMEIARKAKRDPKLKGVKGCKPPESPKGVVALARLHTVSAIQRLARLMNHKNPQVQLAAAETLLNRGWGRAPQVIGVFEGGGTGDRPALTLDEKIAALQSAIGDDGDQVTDVTSSPSLPATTTQPADSAAPPSPPDSSPASPPSPPPPKTAPGTHGMEFRHGGAERLRQYREQRRIRKQQEAALL